MTIKSIPIYINFIASPSFDEFMMVKEVFILQMKMSCSKLFIYRLLKREKIKKSQDSKFSAHHPLSFHKSSPNLFNHHII